MVSLPPDVSASAANWWRPAASLPLAFACKQALRCEVALAELTRATTAVTEAVAMTDNGADMRLAVDRPSAPARSAKKR